MTTSLLAIRPRYSITKPFYFTTPGAEFAGTFCLLRGGHRRRILESGNIEESYELYSSAGYDAISQEVRQLNKVFQQLRLTAEQKTARFEAHVLERATGENFERSARLISGSINLIDGSVIDSKTMYKGVVTAVLVIERAPIWEFGPEAFKEFEGLEAWGDTETLPIPMTQGTEPGRIKFAKVRAPIGQKFQKIWMGIKPRLDYPLSGFEGRIRMTGANHSWFHDETILVLGTQATSDAYIDNNGYQFSFVSQTDGNQRDVPGQPTPVIDEFSDWHALVMQPLSNWNATILSGSEVAAGRDPYRAYVGRYHAVLRYKLYADSGGNENVRLGLRGFTAWGRSFDENAVLKYLPRKTLNQYPDIWRYVDLGIVTVGGEGWNRDLEPAYTLASFNMGVSAALFGISRDDYASDDEHIAELQKFRLCIDDITLVPAEHFINVEFPREVTHDKHAWIYTNDMNEISANIATGNLFSDYVGVSPQNSTILERATLIDSHNWGTPIEDGSKFVLLTERGEIGSQGVQSDNVRTLALHVLSRSMEFSGW